MRRVGQVRSFGESREILRSLYGSHASATRRVGRSDGRLRARAAHRDIPTSM